jgi:hypothetical protein
MRTPILLVMSISMVFQISAAYGQIKLKDTDGSFIAVRDFKKRSGC